MAIRLPLRARRLTSLPLRSVPVRIRNGPNRGRRWSLAASGRGIWSGRYERERFDALTRLVHEHDVFWDIGAHRGYATLLAESRIGAAGTVHAFEPSGENFQYLRKHLRWNEAEQVTVHRAAIADFDGTTTFGGTGSSVSHRIGGGSEDVPVRTVSALAEEGLAPPTFLKIDVEGAESRVLEGARELLEARRDAEEPLPVILVSVHSGPQLTSCLAFLRELGYRILGSANLRRFMDTLDAAWSEDPDLLATPPDGRLDRSGVGHTPWFQSGPDLSPIDQP